MTNMDNQSNQQNQAKGFETIPELKQMPFAVSSDYFDTLQKKIMLRIKVIEETEKSFALPVRYFEDFPNRLKQRIEIEESTDGQEIGQLPISIQAEAGFSVPDHYFENLAHTISAKTQQKATGDILINEEQRDSSKIRKLGWLRYAAAACIIFGLGSVLLFQLNSSNQTFQHRLENIPETEIINYLEYYSESDNGLSTDAQLEEIMQTSGKPSFSDEEIQAYLDYSI